MIESGICSHCKKPAERGQSGAWWHVNGSCWMPFVEASRNPSYLRAHFVPSAPPVRSEAQ